MTIVLKMKRSFETEVFVNEDGYLVIKQSADETNTETDLILLTPMQVNLLHNNLPRLSAVQKDRWKEQEIEGDDE